MKTFYRLLKQDCLPSLLPNQQCQSTGGVNVNIYLGKLFRPVLFKLAVWGTGIRGLTRGLTPSPSPR